MMPSSSDEFSEESIGFNGRTPFHRQSFTGKVLMGSTHNDGKISGPSRDMEDQLETDFSRKLSIAESEEDDSERSEKRWEMEEGRSEESDQTENIAQQMFEKMPRRIHHLYFVKQWPNENPNMDAIIKRDEEIIEKMNEDHNRITQQIKDKREDQLELQWRLRRLGYNEEGLRTEVRWRDETLKFQKKALDRLSFANNAYSKKGFESCVANGEVDKQKLQFQMLHGCRNMSEEKKMLRVISETQKKDHGITFEDLNPSTRKAGHYYCSYYPYQIVCDPSDHDAVKKEVNRLEQEKEKAIANAVVNGKIWNSLGSKKDLQNKLNDTGSNQLEAYKKQRVMKGRIKQIKSGVENIERNIASLEKQLRITAHRKDLAYNSILSLKKLYGEENARFYQYRSLLKKATTLADKKDIAGLQELSHKEVEDFMSKWNSDKYFRDEYKKRSVQSQNIRKLGRDGRRMDDTDEMPFEEETQRIVKPEALSKTRLKWLMKEHF